MRAACLAATLGPMVTEAWSISHDTLGHCRCDVGYCSCDHTADSQPGYELAKDVEFMVYASVVLCFYIGLPLLAIILASYGIYNIGDRKSLCRAERRYANLALAAWKRHNESITVPFGAGLNASADDDLGHILFPGMNAEERMDELCECVGLAGGLSAEEAQEGVRRVLACIDPWMSPHASERDCAAIAAPILAAVGCKSSHPSRLAATSRPWKPKGVPPPPCPPWWLERVQICTYVCARRLFNALGLHSRWAETPECSLHWWDSGATPRGGDATPLVLIHGMFTTGASMCLLGLLLKRRRRVIVIDLPGFDYSYSAPHEPLDHGACVPQPRECTLASCTNAVCWLVEHLIGSVTAADEFVASGVRNGANRTGQASRGGERGGQGLCAVDLVGHSFGANVAIAVANRLPQSAVRHVHLLAPGGASASTFSSFTKMPDFHSLVPIPWLRPLIVPVLNGIFASPNTANLILEPSFIAAVRRRHAAASPALNRPCNLLFGTADALVTPRPLSGIAHSYPYGELTWLVHARHQLNVLNPAAVAACIDAFATRHGGGGDSAIVGRVAVGSGGILPACMHCLSLALDSLLGVRAEIVDLREQRASMGRQSAEGGAERR